MAVGVKGHMPSLNKGKLKIQKQVTKVELSSTNNNIEIIKPGTYQFRLDTESTSSANVTMRGVPVTVADVAGQFVWDQGTPSAYTFTYVGEKIYRTYDGVVFEIIWDGLGSQRFTARSVINTSSAQPPVWVTSAGSLGSFAGGSSVNITLQATDDGSIYGYYLASGSLPSGVSMDSYGRITGTVPNVMTNTSYPITITVKDNAGNTTNRDFTIDVLANQPPVWNTPAGTLGSVAGGLAVSKTLSATDPEGKTVTYTIQSGSLPTGVTLSSAGLISGIAPVSPTLQTFTFTVRATDGDGIFADRTFSLDVAANLPPVWNTNFGSLGTVKSGGTATYNLSATDPEGKSVTYAIQNGSLPSGFTLSNAGTITGTANIVVNAEIASFTVRATDADGMFTDRNFSITVAANLPPVWFTNASLSPITGGTAVNITLVANDPELQTVTYTLQDGTLPIGLTLSSSGVISGTAPVVTGTETSSFTVRASDPLGAFEDRIFTLDVIANQVPVWTTDADLGIVKEKASFSKQLQATDSDGTIAKYELVTGTLPAGITLTNAGLLSGTAPTVTADTAYTFTIRVTDNNAGYTDRDFTLLVKDNLPPVWTTSGNIGTYNGGSAMTNYQLQASDPDGTIASYTVVSGALPTGVTLSSAGLLSGTPANPASNTTYSFTVRATDNTGDYTDQALSLTVNYVVPSAPNNFRVTTTFSGTTKSYVIPAGHFSGTFKPTISCVKSGNDRAVRFKVYVGATLIYNVAVDQWTTSPNFNGTTLPTEYDFTGKTVTVSWENNGGSGSTSTWIQVNNIPGWGQNAPNLVGLETYTLP